MDTLLDFVRRYPRLFVLSGAGISTASGIPAYRDREGKWLGGNPTQYQDFMQHPAARRRYWARSLVGWRTVDRAKPNAAHRALVSLAGLGHLERVVTQNVDGLHQEAGSSETIELHGNIGRVICMVCRTLHSRARIQTILEADNPWVEDLGAAPAPDGDAHFEPTSLERFIEPPCPACGGLLKPDVVFFGESVPRERVEQATETLRRADAMLVVGSSLTVYSGYRFCLWASQMSKPIAAINLGLTRADPLLSLKIEQTCADALTRLVDHLHPPEQDIAL